MKNKLTKRKSEKVENQISNFPNSILNLFLQNVAQIPEAIGLIDSSNSYTYYQLDQISNFMAAKIEGQTHGLLPFVATLLPQGKDFMVTTLATFKTSSTLAPLSIEHPTEKLELMLRDLGNPLLVSSQQILGDLKLKYDHTLILENLDNHVAAKFETSKNLPNPTAYVFYTSGSTGTPKAVTMGHAQLMHDIEWATKKYELRQSDHSVLFLNPAFSFTTQEIWPCWAAGGTLVVPPPNLKYDVPSLRDWMNVNLITVITLPAPLAETFYTLALIDSRSNTLRWLICGSGILNFTIPSELPYQISYCYGSTEALRITEITLSSSWAEGAENRRAQTVVGKPIDGVLVYVLDEEKNSVEVGKIGEIYVGGANMSREGYLNRHECNKYKFVENHFSPTSGPLYRTGDFGCFLLDGNLEIIGRADDQVKVRGHRVELGEIRQVLLDGFPGLQNVVVLCDKNEFDDTEIHAFCVVGKSEDFSVSHAYDILQRKVPHYSLPTSITTLPAFPLNPNGKLDRLRLVKMRQVTPKVESSSPKSKTEEIVSSIWAEILKLHTREISLCDNFFALGGNSMAAAKVVGCLQSKFNFIQLKIYNIFTASTLQSFSALLDTMGQGGKEDDNLCERNSENFANEFQLSFQQEQIWLYSQQINYPGLYLKISSLVFPDCDSSLQKIEKCLNIVLERHPILGVEIFEKNGSPFQKLNKNFSKVILEVVDLSDQIRYENWDESSLLEIQEVSSKVRANIASNQSGPYMKFLAVKTVDKITVIIFCHHLVIDGIGIRLFNAEVSALFQNFQNPKIPNLTYNYTEYVLEQRSSNEKLGSKFWKNRLEGLRALELQPDFPRAVNFTPKRTGIKRFTIPKELSNAVRDFARDNETTVFVTLLSAFKALIYRYTQQEDMFVLVPSDGRVNSNLTPLIGHFVNMIIVRNVLKPSENFKSLVSQVRENVTSSLEHQNYPLQKIIQDCKLTKTDAGLLRFCVGMEPKIDIESSIETSAQYDLAPNLGTTIFEVFLNFEELSNSQLGGSIEFDRNLYTEHRIERLISHFIEIVSSVTADLSSNKNHLASLKYLPNLEVAKLQEFGNCRKRELQLEVEENETLLSMFTAIVKKTPHWIAIEDGSVSMTFEELDSKSSCFAPNLASENIFVAVHLPANSFYVTTILAILKAGKCIVPIDINQPRSRVAAILESLNFPTLVTTSSSTDIQSYSKVLFIDKFEFQIEVSIKLANFLLDKSTTSGDLFYLFHTSGSTGVPKAVEDRNDGLVNVIKWFQKELKINSTDRQLLYTSPGFDGSVCEIWPCLTAGGTLVTCPPELRTDINGLRSWVTGTTNSTSSCADAVRGTITRLNLTTVVAELFYSCKTSNFRDSSIKSIVCGGEKLRSLPPRGIPFKIYNVYGVTEASVWSTCVEITAYQNDTIKYSTEISSIPIGRPISGVQIYVVDENLWLVPIGIPGEILIGGDSVSTGYWLKPTLTQQKFLTNIFGAENGARNSNSRVYRTGDIGWWDEDGNLFCQGRIDEQVKIRGFRVELSEIEHILCSVPNIQSAVVVSEQKSNIHLLHAFVIPTNHDAEIPPSSEIHAHLAKILPQYAIPSTITQVEKFPQTPSGKIDRKALISLPKNAGQDLTTTAIEKPETELESFLVETWSKVLEIEVENISVNANFFSLGGNSLLIGQLVNFLSSELDQSLRLSTATIYAHPTIRKLALNLKDRLNLRTF